MLRILFVTLFALLAPLAHAETDQGCYPACRADGWGFNTCYDKCGQSNGCYEFCHADGWSFSFCNDKCGQTLCQ